MEKYQGNLNFGRRPILLCLCLCLCCSLANAEPSDAQRLERLNAAFKTIEADAVTSRVLNGLGVMIEGGAIITFGVVFFSPPYFGTTDVTKVGEGLFIGIGVAAGITGFVLIFIPTKFETFPKKYNAMPNSSEDEIRDKVAVGETTLAQLRSDAFNQRMLTGISGAIGGGLFLAQFVKNLLASMLLPSSFYIPGLILFGAGSAFMLTVSLINILVESVPEKQAAEYEQWKSGNSTAGVSSAHPQIAFRAWGLGAAFSLSF
jgi:hypothetical protein